MIQQKSVRCPNCGVLLNVKNSQNETEKFIDCPRCKAPLRVKFPVLKSGERLDAVTEIVGRPRKDDGETRTADRKDDGCTVMASPKKQTKRCYLQYGTKQYPLEIGHNTVGRKASSSSANVQIDTSDIYMSRRHLSISVTTISEGLTKAVACNDKNKNDTFVNGTRLSDGDRVVLTDGSKIRMGDTVVTYKEES